MHHLLSSVVERYKQNPSLMESATNYPWLIWDMPSLGSPEEEWMKTSAILLPASQSGEPLAFEVHKAEASKTLFSMGVTVGRLDRNDISIDHQSLSRFHAYFQNEGTQWFLTDAESRNGTWVGPLRLSPKQKVLVQDKSKLRFGTVHLEFLLHNSFIERMKTLAK